MLFLEPSVIALTSSMNDPSVAFDSVSILISADGLPLLE